MNSSSSPQIVFSTSVDITAKLKSDNHLIFEVDLRFCHWRDQHFVPISDRLSLTSYNTTQLVPIYLDAAAFLSLAGSYIKQLEKDELNTRFEFQIGSIHTDHHQLYR